MDMLTLRFSLGCAKICVKLSNQIHFAVAMLHLLASGWIRCFLLIDWFWCPSAVAMCCSCLINRYPWCRTGNSFILRASAVICRKLSSCAAGDLQREVRPGHGRGTHPFARYRVHCNTLSPIPNCNIRSPIPNLSCFRICTNQTFNFDHQYISIIKIDNIKLVLVDPSWNIFS